MRAERNRHPEDDGQPGALHRSGGFPEAVYDPCDGSARHVPEQGQDQCRDTEKASSRLRIWIDERDDAENSPDHKERGRYDQPYPMKAARQPIHGPLLQFTTSTCLFPRPPASGDAVLALASFGMIAWAMMRGLA